MRPNSKTLALRDPALAILLGGLAATENSDFGADFPFAGDFEFGEDAPTPQNMARAWKEKQATRQREALISPNANSSLKIQRYAFALTQTVALGTAEDLDMSDKPETYIRPQRVTCNAPIAGFARISNIKVANVGVIVGGELDAFEFNANGVDQALDVPTLSPANSVTVEGTYDGRTPTGYTAATDFVVVVSFKGPATMVA